MINALRDTVSQGGQSIPDELRPLYLGLVIGDDRGASSEMTADLRAAGLAHLAVVSGENLIFVMVLVAPLLSRVGMRRRFALLLTVLTVFLSITRFEPSILRAAAMTLVAGVAVGLGRPASPIRVMALGVILLLLADPLIVESIAFRLSLAATAGIIVLVGPIARGLPLPGRAAVACAVPVAAQLGVAPIAIPMFGPQPLLAIPANLLAEPAAALVMMWGCTVGVIAGAVGGVVGTALQWPAMLALRWILLVAHTTAGLHGPRVGLAHLAAVATVLGVLWLIGRSRPPRSTGSTDSLSFHSKERADDR
jgi:competence protein ComEC